MDGRRFDLLAKALSEVSSRRDALKVTVSGAAAGLLGITLADDETEARKRDRRDSDRRGKRNRRHRRKKERKICDCPDNNEKNCVTKTVNKRKARKIKDNHPNSYNGRCKDGCLSNNTECYTNRPGECCSGLCCLDYLSGTNGICPTDGGNCCGRVDRGGYCPSQAPDCCGTDACCSYEQVCCATALDRTGWCCPPDSTCGLARGDCEFAQSAEINSEQTKTTTVERVRLK